LLEKRGHLNLALVLEREEMGTVEITDKKGNRYEEKEMEEKDQALIA
jgi:hypothetical protein